MGMAEASVHPTRPRCSQGGGAPELHGWQQSGVPKSLLKAMLKTLGFEWCPSGPCGTLLQWLAKGQDRAAYTCQGMVFKISELPQFPELRLSRRFPGVVAKVFWAEEIVLVLHGPDTAMRFPMTLLLKDRGENFAFRFSVLRCMRPHVATVPRVHTLGPGRDKHGNHDGLCCLPTARCSFL